MFHYLQIIGWLACAVYSTIPAFWFMIHPFAERWRTRHRSPYVLLVPVWMAMWAAAALVTRPWRGILLYQTGWAWGAAVLLFACGLYIYSQSGKNFSAKQLGGLPEVHGGNREQRLVTDGIRSRVRHPVYLGHLCEMLAWSVGTGLAVCWALTAFAVLTGAVMIRMEDAELEKRFGEEYRSYRSRVPTVLPRLMPTRKDPVPRLSCDGASIRYEVHGEGVWQIAVSDLACLGEYTTANGPFVDDYFLAFSTKDGVYREASFYSDGRDEMLNALGKGLGCVLRLALAQSTVLASRIIWPKDLEGHPLFIEKSINPEVERLTGSRQL